MKTKKKFLSLFMLLIIFILSACGNKHKTIDTPSADTKDYTYTGSEITYQIAESDYYTISGNKQTNAGTYEVTLSLKDQKNYSWSSTNNAVDLKYRFVISPMKVQKPTVSSTVFSYTGSEITLEIPTSNHYKITGNKNTDVGDYTAIVSLNDKTNYIWSDNTTSDITFNYSIKDTDLSKATISSINDVTYTGEAITPTPEVTFNGKTLTLNTDYQISYQNNVNVGEATLTINGIDEYKNSKSINFNIVKATPKVFAPVAKELTYNGEALELITAGSTSFGNLQYKLNNGEYSESIPTATNAGTYTVYYKVDGTDNYNGYAESPIEVTIAKANPTLTAPTEKKNLVYSGEPLELINAGSTTAGTILYKLNDGEYSSSIPTATLPGTYKVYYKVTGNDNYNDIAEDFIEVTINKLNPTVTKPTPKDNLVYNGLEQELINAGSAIGGTINYKLENGEYSTTIPTAKNAGTYKIYYKVVADENYNDLEENSLEVIIDKDDSFYSAIPTAITDLSYNGNPQELIYEGFTSCGVIEYKLNDGEYSSSIPTATNVDTYTVYYRIIGDENHKDLEESSIKVTIAKGNPIITAPTPKDDLVYNGSAQKLVDPAETSGGTIQYKLENGEYSSSIPTATNAGEYKVYYKVIGNDLYNDSEESYVTTSISKIDPTFTAPSPLNNLIYNGNSQALIEAGSTNGGVMKYQLDSGEFSTDIPTAVNAGEYAVYYRVEGDINYNDTMEVSISISIEKADVDLIIPTAEELTYNGSEQVLIIAGSANVGTLQYKLDGDEYSAALPKATNAGTYTVYFKLVLNNDNYNQVDEQSFDVTINKANPTVTAPTAIEGLICNDAEQVLINAGSATGGTLLYKLDNGQYSTTPPKATNAGTYTVYYMVEGDDNHNDIDETSFQVVINPKEGPAPTKTDPVVTAPTPRSLTYNGTELTLIEAGSTTGGTLQYKLNDGEYSTTLPKAINHGTYTVYYKVVGNTYYNDVAEASIKVTIAKATPTYVSPSSKKNLVYNGTDQALISGGSTSHGTMKYSLIENDGFSTEIPSGNNANTYIVYFYVEGDSNHNNSDVLYVTVTIKKAEVTKPTYSTNTYVYTGSTITHNLTNSSLYTITDNTAINVGDSYAAKVNLNDTDNYCWKEATYTPTSIDELSYSFEITPKTLTSSMVTFDNNLVYNGETQAPTVTVSDNTFLTSNDYTLTNEGGKNVGTYHVIVEAKGNYNGTVDKTFTITARAITITLTNQSSVYKTSGEYEIAQDAYTVGENQLITGDDLGISITKSEGTNVGDYTLNATITNTNYNPTIIAATYTINSQNIDISNATIKLNGVIIDDADDVTTSYSYTGLVQRPTISLICNTTDVNSYELLLDTDYSISIDGNQIKAATYTITITGKGNYFTGSVQRKYAISKKELTNYTLTFNQLIYNGTEQKPTSFILIDNDLDSSVNDITSQFTFGTGTIAKINAGTGSDYIVKITTKSGSQSQYNNLTISSTYEILKCDISKCTYSTIYDAPLTSNVIEHRYLPEPKVMNGSVELTKNTDYTLTYGDNNSLGPGWVKITGIGTNYESEKTIEFNITNSNVVLIFNPNGGLLNSLSTSQEITFEYPYDSNLPTPTRTNYDFTGWRTEVMPYKTFDVTASLDKLVGYTSFVAQWKLHEYSITYENVSNNNTYGNPTSYTYDDEDIILLNPSDTSFIGWYSDSEFENEITVIPHNSTGDIIIYAKWNVDKYFIKYNTNGGNEIEDGEYTQSTSTFSLPIPTKDNYEFGGWYTNDGLTGDPIEQITQGTTGNINLWAKWTPTTYYITYNSTGDGIHGNQTSYTVETPTFTLNNETKGGNIFVGWYTLSTGGEKVTEITNGSCGSKTLYARFTPIPTSFEIVITHDESHSATADAATLNGTNIGSKYVGNTINPSLTINDTYTFIGWYNGESLVSTNPSFEATLTESTTVYTAKVARYRIVVTDNSSGGSTSPAGISYVRAGENIELTATTNTAGYVFAGWFLNEETTPLTLNYTLNVIMGSSDAVYQANWSHLTLTKVNSDNLYNNTITNLNGTNYIKGNTIDLEATPDDGYAFKGWYNGNTLLSRDLTYTYTFKDEDEALTAEFIKNQITVTPGYLGATEVNEIPVFTLATGGNYGTSETNNIMDNNGYVTYTATNENIYMFVGWYEIGDSGITVNNKTYELISREKTIKLEPGNSKTIYPLYIGKLGAFADPYFLEPTSSGGNYSGDSVIITPITNDAYEFTKYTINGVDVESTDTRLDGNVLTYTEDIDNTLSSATNLYHRDQIMVIYTRISALIQFGVIDNNSFTEKSNVGTITKNGNVYTASANVGYEFITWKIDDGYTGDVLGSEDSRISGDDNEILTLSESNNEDYFAIFAPLSNIDYTIEYYLQNVDDDDYTLDHSKNNNNDGITDKAKTITPEEITGATINNTKSSLTKTINGDGSTVFKLYFDRNMVTVKYQYNNGTSTTFTNESQRYGSLPKENNKEGWTKEIAGWYTDADLTTPFVGTIKEEISLYAKWQGDLELSSCEKSSDTISVTIKVNDDIASSLIEANENIIIPSYYNGLPVTTVNVNNLIVNGKIYAKVVMPDNLSRIIYGYYNTNPITWIVLKSNDGYKLLNETAFESTVSKANIDSTLISLSSTLGFNITLLPRELFDENTDKITTLSVKWWLALEETTAYKVDENTLEYSISESKYTKCSIRAYIEL